MTFEISPEDFKQIRTELADMSQTDFGALFGLTKVMVQKIEAGTAIPSLKVMFMMCIRFNININISPNVKHPLLAERVGVLSSEASATTAEESEEA